MKKLLDLFCGAGGAATGYHQAGINQITGIDNRPQPRYPFQFIQADALEYLTQHGHQYDIIHASPPCQAYSRLKGLTTSNYPKLITPLRRILKQLQKPYIIENVPEAPLENPLTLCGTMFGLRLIRHRAFETNPTIWWPPAPCNHWGRASSCFMRDDRGKRVSASFDNTDFISVTGAGYKVAHGRIAMGIDWMTRDELSQAIPPAYTKWLGEQILKKIGENNANKN